MTLEQHDDVGLEAIEFGLQSNNVIDGCVSGNAGIQDLNRPCAVASVEDALELRRPGTVVGGDGGIEGGGASVGEDTDPAWRPCHRDWSSPQPEGVDVYPAEIVAIMNECRAKALVGVVQRGHGAGRGGAMAFAPPEGKLTQGVRNDQRQEDEDNTCHESDTIRAVDSG